MEIVCNGNLGSNLSGNLVSASHLGKWQPYLILQELQYISLDRAICKTFGSCIRHASKSALDQRKLQSLFTLLKHLVYCQPSWKMAAILGYCRSYSTGWVSNVVHNSAYLHYWKLPTIPICIRKIAFVGHLKNGCHIGFPVRHTVGVFVSYLVYL